MFRYHQAIYCTSHFNDEIDEMPKGRDTYLGNDVRWTYVSEYCGSVLLLANNQHQSELYLSLVAVSTSYKSLLISRDFPHIILLQ